MTAPIEQTARSLVAGARQAAYGSPAADFARTGKIWGALLNREPISPEMVAVMMAALKLSRLAETPRHLDSRVDAIGYMIALDEVIRDQESREYSVSTHESLDAEPLETMVGDGFGNEWQKCSAECDLQVVRPGDAQCSCERKAA